MKICSPFHVSTLSAIRQLRFPLGLSVIHIAVFLTQGQSGEESVLNKLTIDWITVNYVGLVLWVFVWMIDQTRMRGKNAWVWLLPFLLAPWHFYHGRFYSLPPFRRLRADCLQSDLVVIAKIYYCFNTHFS